MDSPDEVGVYSVDDARWIYREVLKFARTQKNPRGRMRPSGRSVPQMPQVAACRVTSLVAGTGAFAGWNPGTFRIYDSTAKTWSEPAPCWLFDLSGNAYPDTTTAIPGFLIASAADGSPVVCTWYTTPALSVLGGGGGAADINSFRQIGNWYPAGKITDANSLTSSQVFQGNQIYAVPFYTGAYGGTVLDKIAIKWSGANSGQVVKARLGVYLATAPRAGNLVPGALLADFGEVSITGPSPNTVTAGTAPGGSVAVPSGSLVWLAINLAQIGGPAIYATGSPDFYNVFGTDANFDGPPSTGYLSAQAYGPMPNAFPAGSPVGGALPLICAHFTG